MELLFTVVFVVALVDGAFASWLASEKGRDGFKWFLLGFFFSPIALLALMGAPQRVRQRRQRVASGQCREGEHTGRGEMCTTCGYD